MKPARRRGQDTKERVLETACKVFAEKGYRDATHAEICRRAHTNVAAINYYFESKEALYRAAFEHLNQKVDTLYPIHGGLLATATPQQRLRAFIHAHLSVMFDMERLGCLHRILMSEMFDSTGLLTEPMNRRMGQLREYLLGILRELMGPQTSPKDLEWCEMSIVGQCFMAAPRPRNESEGPHAAFGLDATQTNNLADHITEFSLAGIEAIRRRGTERAGLTRDGD